MENPGLTAVIFFEKRRAIRQRKIKIKVVNDFGSWYSSYTAVVKTSSEARAHPKKIKGSAGYNFFSGFVIF
jgi:hypothetical protein